MLYDDLRQRAEEELAEARKAPGIGGLIITASDDVLERGLFITPNTVKPIGMVPSTGWGLLEDAGEAWANLIRTAADDGVDLLSVFPNTLHLAKRTCVKLYLSLLMVASRSDEVGEVMRRNFSEKKPYRTKLSETIRHLREQCSAGTISPSAVQAGDQIGYVLENNACAYHLDRSFRNLTLSVDDKLSEFRGQDRDHLFQKAWQQGLNDSTLATTIQSEIRQIDFAGQGLFVAFGEDIAKILTSGYIHENPLWSLRFSDHVYISLRNITTGTFAKYRRFAEIVQSTTNEVFFLSHFYHSFRRVDYSFSAPCFDFWKSAYHYLTCFSLYNEHLRSNCHIKTLCDLLITCTKEVMQRSPIYGSFEVNRNMMESQGEALEKIVKTEKQ